MFILPEPSPPDLFILYPPGARGDFLAAVLKDSIVNHYKNYSVAPPTVGYQKTHYVQDLTERSIFQYKNRIRIVVSEVEEYLTVAQLWLDKIPTPNSWTAIMSTLIHEQTYIREHLDPDFHHVINFKQLYDIEFIKQLYYTINARELAQDVVEKIQFNISLQPWITQTRNRLEPHTTVQNDQHPDDR